MTITTVARKEVAQRLGLSDQYLYQCLTGRRDMDPADAVRVEVGSGGVIRREHLRRDWRLIWPELQMREGPTSHQPSEASHV